METRFVRGLRVSDAETRDLALAVLGGLANGRVVATLIARGVPAAGARRNQDEQSDPRSHRTIA